MTEYKKYQLLKDIVLPGRIIPEGAIYEEYHTGRSYVNNREPYKPHFISPATIRQYPDWFKGIPPQPSSIDRIEVKSIPNKQDERSVVGCLKEIRHHGVKEFWYEFVIIGKSAKDELPAIKQAIEAAINGDKEVPQWYSEDEIYEWLKHKKYSHEIALELSGYWYRDLQGAFKKGWEKANHELKSEVDTIREETWKAARGYWDFNKYGFPKYEYPTLQDYLNSLSKPSTTPIEDKGNVLFTTEDGVDVCSNDVKCYCVYPNDCKIQMVYASRNELSNMDWKRFNVKENAERWLIENKPCLSLNDLLDVWGNADIEPKERTRYKGSPLFQEFEQHAKQKLKQ